MGVKSICQPFSILVSLCRTGSRFIGGVKGYILKTDYRHSRARLRRSLRTRVTMRILATDEKPAEGCSFVDSDPHRFVLTTDQNC